MSWIFLTIISATFQGTASIIDKYVLGNEVKNPKTAIVLWGYWAFILFSAYSIISNNFTLNPAAILIGILIGIFYVFSFKLYYRAVPILEISRLLPTITLVPVLTAIYATIFFHARFSLTIYIGILGILLGVLFTDYQKLDKRKHLRLGYLIAIFACVIFSLKNILTKYSSFIIHNPGAIMLWVGVGALIGALYIHLTNVQEIHTHLKQHKGIHHLLTSTFLSVMAAISYTWAITIGPISLVAFLSQLQVPYVFLIASILDIVLPKALHENVNRKIFLQKLFGISLILVGSFFLIF